MFIRPPPALIPEKLQFIPKAVRFSYRWSPPLELIVSPAPHTEPNSVRFLLFQKQIARLYPVFFTTIKPKAQFNIWIWKGKTASTLNRLGFEMREQGMTSSTLCILVCSLSAAASQWTQVVSLPCAPARNWPLPWLSGCAICCFFIPLLKSLEWKDMELETCRHSFCMRSRGFSDKLPPIPLSISIPLVANTDQKTWPFWDQLLVSEL